MAERKGFMHIVEIIIIILLIFFLLFQFSRMPTRNESWQETETKILLNDMGRSLSKLNVDWFDPDSIDRNVVPLLPSTFIYSVKLTNVMKPVIRIGCYADEDVCNNLRDALDIFYINGHNVTFIVNYIDSIDKLFQLNYDVYLINRYEEELNKDGFYVDAMKRYLDEDKGVIEILYLDDDKINDIQKTIFGLNKTGERSNTNTVFIYHTLESSIDDFDKFMRTNMLYHTPLFYDEFNTLGKWIVVGDADLRIETNDGIIESSGYLEYLRDACDTGIPYFSNSIRPANNVIISNSTIVFYFKLYRDSNLDVFLRYDADFNTYPIPYSTYKLRINRTGAFLYYEESTGGVETRTVIESMPMSISEDVWHKAVVDMKGDSIVVFIDEKEYIRVSNRYFDGLLFLRTCRGNGVLLDNFRVYMNSEYMFGDIINGQNVTSINGDDTIILKQKGSDAAAAVINYDVVNARGRTAWVSDSILSFDRHEYMAILKFLIVWAAGHSYNVIDRDITRPVTTKLHKVLDIDMFQPITVEISAGYTVTTTG